VDDAFEVWTDACAYTVANLLQCAGALKMEDRKLEDRFVVLHFPVITFTPIVLQWSSFFRSSIFSQPQCASEKNVKIHAKLHTVMIYDIN